MISYSTQQRCLSTKIPLPCAAILLLVASIGNLSTGAAFAQQPDTPYVSESDFRKKVEADKNAELFQKLEALRGKTFWYLPNPNAILKIAFFEPSKTGAAPESFSAPKFVVQTETSFTVTGYEQGKYNGYYLKLEFPDGKIGYLEVYSLATRYPDEYPLIENLYTDSRNYDFKEYIYSRPPREIFAAKRKAAAERKAKQAKANAERKANKAKADAERKARCGVKIGMTKAQVLNSNWGNPSHVNRTVNQNGTREQWVYGGGNYLYFDDGKLTAIQN